MNFWGNNGGRGVSAHAARVRAHIMIEQALMVLAGSHGQNVFAIDHHDKAGFFAFEEVFNHHAGTGRTKGISFEHIVNGPMGLIQIHGDDYALTGRQSVSLNNDRSTFTVHISMSRGGITESFIVSRRHPVALHEGFGKVLGAFKLCGSFSRSENLQSSASEVIHDTRSQRGFRTHHCEAYVIGCHKVSQPGDIGLCDIDQFFGHRSTGIAGSHKHGFNSFILSQAPGNRMFATTAANNENLHG